MGSLREIKDRIGSVRSTLKITSAMKLVASSKLRKAQRDIEAMIPYRKALEDILTCIPMPAVEVNGREGGKVAVVAMASNSSLCGSFNSNAVKAALQEAAKYDDSVIIAVGRKMSEAVAKAGYPQERDWSSLVASPTYEKAASLADFVIGQFNSGAFSKVVLVYNHFISTSRQEPVQERFLPEESVGREEDRDDAQIYIFEPDAAAIASELRPKVLKLKMFSAALDSVASEHAARTIAMQTATDNAEDILSDLTLEYNKGRQQKITSEILDLVAGSSEH